MEKGLNFLKKYWHFVLIALVVLYVWRKKKDDGGDKKDGSAPTDVVVDKAKLTYPLNQYVLWADSIEQSLGLGGNWNPYEYDSDVGDVLKNMNTDDDYYQLVAAFGTRSNFAWTKINLPQALATLLDDDIKQDVNSNWAAKGMITSL